MHQRSASSILLIATVYLKLTIAVSTDRNATTSYNRNNNIAFELPDLTKIIDTTEGEYQLEAYKSVLNDEILKSADKSRNSQLFWVSLGNIQLLRDAKSTNTSSIFRATPEGYYAYISSLTEYHRKQLAEAASLKYNTKINTSQIVNLILSEFTCILDLYTAEGRKMIVRGEVTSFQRYPLRMDFLMPPGSKERRLFEQRILLMSKEAQLTLKCKVSSSGQQLKINTLVINWELSNQLGITNELFGPSSGSGDSKDKAVTVTRKQLARLSAELYNTLSVQETYEIPQTQFTESFIQDLLKQVAPKGISPMSVDSALSLLSKYSIDYGRDLRPDEIVRDIGSILKVGKFGNKSRIILDKDSFQQLITKNKISGGLSTSSSILGAIKIGGSVKFASENELNSQQSLKSLDDQLRELNTESTDDVKWEIEGTRVVPKSLNVARVLRSSLQRTLVFQRIRRQFTDAAFRRSFALYSTYTGTPPDALAALHTAVSQVRSEMTAGMSALQGHVTQLRNETIALNSNNAHFVLGIVTDVRARMAPLVDSSHCILANGACPAGYSRHEGLMKAILVKPQSMAFATFGNSSLYCPTDGSHCSCPDDQCVGALRLVACCK